MTNASFILPPQFDRFIARGRGNGGGNQVGEVLLMRLLRGGIGLGMAWPHRDVAERQRRIRPTLRSCIGTKKRARMRSRRSRNRQRMTRASAKPAGCPRNESAS
jgi:hypothetical protein